MTCAKCREPAVFLNPKLCRNHFVSHFEDKVMRTIKRYRMLSHDDNIGVAASGGKDSTACLHILSKHYRNVTAVAIDEGIKGYRRNTLRDLKAFCRARGIKLEMASCKKELGRTLDSLATEGKSACSICGAMRRHLINVHAKRLGLTAVATGHNMDDEAQSIMMNLFKNNMYVRLLPATSIPQPGFVKRVKPLYFCTEKESFLYAHLAGLGTGFNECPYTKNSFRNTVRDLINGWEAAYPGAKRNIIRNYLRTLPRTRKGESGRPNLCKKCSEPCSGDICKVCGYLGYA